MGPVELQLLIGKVYSQWDKHFASALAVYDGLIEKFPDDFRHAHHFACLMTDGIAVFPVLFLHAYRECQSSLIEASQSDLPEHIHFQLSLMPSIQLNHTELFA